MFICMYANGPQIIGGWVVNPFKPCAVKWLYFSVLSAWVPEPKCQKIKKGGLDQYGSGHFEV